MVLAKKDFFTWKLSRPEVHRAHPPGRIFWFSPERLFHLETDGTRSGRVASPGETAPANRLLLVHASSEPPSAGEILLAGEMTLSSQPSSSSPWGPAVNLSSKDFWGQTAVSMHMRAL